MMAGALALAGSTHAAFVSPISYDMLNGDSGSFPYWDRNYTGSGNTTQNRAPLTGGLGDLTDGVIPTLNWNQVENAAGNGPYVGWQGSPSTFHPSVTFHFQAGAVIHRVIVDADDSNGSGGVALPTAVKIAGITYDVDENMPGSAPKTLAFDLQAPIAGSVLDVQFIRSNQWVMISEVRFEGIVPEPASLIALAIGAAALIRRRQL